MNKNLKALHDAGISIWLDDLSRQRIDSGELAEMITDSSVTGVTTNPTIFAAAFKDMSVYGDKLRELKASGADVEEVIRQLMSADVRDACKVFDDIFVKSAGYDGRVSIEVSPELANETQPTIDQAKVLHDLVGAENVLIKIPATKAGLPAIRQTIAAGISVNVTLIFSIERYREVTEAYIAGLEDAAKAGKDLSKIHSVASFFVSRVDTEIDARLEAIGTDQAKALRGKAAVANARLAFEAYEEIFSSERFKALESKGANVQRPLWASTGVKNPDYPDTLYVSELIAKPCVNTMPGATMSAFADHGEVKGDTITANYADAHKVLEDVAAIGVNLDDVYVKLEDEGVEKFIVSWHELVDGVKEALTKA